MSEPRDRDEREEPLIPQMTAFRAELEERAAADFGANRPSRVGRWWRARSRGGRLSVVVAGLVLGAGAAATATSLISVGEPVEIDPKAPSSIRSLNGRTLALTAKDSAVGLPWGVAVFSAPDGDLCALAGQVRAGGLGRVEDGRFRPYPPETVGTCRALKPDAFTVSLQVFDTVPKRSLVYGRAGEKVRAMEVVVSGERFEAPVGRQGAFLFVLDGTVRGDAFRAGVARLAP